MVFMLVVSIAFMILPSLLSAQELPRCETYWQPDKTPHYWFNRFKNAVYKIYAVDYPTKGKKTALGTATLIDTQGYFVTASHIFDKDDPTYNYKSLFPYGLELVNEDGNLPRLVGREIAHRGSESDTDVSLIKVEVSSGSISQFMDIVRPVDPLLDYEDYRTSLMVMGYESGDNALTHHEFMPIKYVSDKREAIVISGIAYGGESGSVAINQGGQAVGVLRRIATSSSPNGKTKIYFAPLAQAPWLLSKIEPSKSFTNMMASLKLGDTQLAVATLNSDKWSSIDCVRLSDELRKFDEDHEYANIRLLMIKPLVNIMICRNMYNKAIGMFANNKNVLNILDGRDTYKLGELSLAVFTAQESIGIPSDRRRPSLEAALMAFEDTERRAKSLYADKTLHPGLSQLKAEYALSLYYAYKAYPDMRISLDDISKRIDESLTLDDKNQYSYAVAATVSNNPGAYKAKLDRTIREMPENDTKKALNTVREAWEGGKVLPSSPMVGVTVGQYIGAAPCWNCGWSYARALPEMKDPLTGGDPETERFRKNEFVEALKHIDSLGKSSLEPPGP